MGQIPNPNQDKPFDRVIKDRGGQAVFGIRAEHTPDEEIVNMQTGESNQKFWQPDPVISPDGCEHAFFLVDPREIECQWCHWIIGFHAKDVVEDNGKTEVIYRGKPYEIKTSS